MHTFSTPDPMKPTELPVLLIAVAGAVAAAIALLMLLFIITLVARGFLKRYRTSEVYDGCTLLFLSDVEEWV